MRRAGGARRDLAQPLREDVSAARSVCDDGRLRSLPADSCADCVPGGGAGRGVRASHRLNRRRPSRAARPGVSVHVLEAVAARRACVLVWRSHVERVGAARSAGEDGRLRSVPADSCADFVARSRSQFLRCRVAHLVRLRPSRAACSGASVLVLVGDGRRWSRARAGADSARLRAVWSGHVGTESARLVLSVRMAAVAPCPPTCRVAHHSADYVLQGPVVRGLRATAASCARGSRSARLTGCSHVERGRSAPRWLCANLGGEVAEPVLDVVLAREDDGRLP